MHMCTYSYICAHTHMCVYLYTQYVSVRTVPVPLLASVLQISMSCDLQSESSLSVLCGE